MEYIHDADGKWSVRNGNKYCLVEPSEAYLARTSLSQTEIERRDAEVLLSSTKDEFLAMFEDLVIELDKVPTLNIPTKLKELAVQRKNARDKLEV